jgi:hypothetical protein
MELVVINSKLLKLLKLISVSDKLYIFLTKFIYFLKTYIISLFTLLINFII